MIPLQDLHRSQGATLAPDGIPLHYNDLAGEYQAALEQVVLMDRSHEGRMQMTGRDRYTLIQRMSTHDVVNLQTGQGRPTIFTNPNGRILDRIILYHQNDDTALVTTEPGRGEAVLNYVKGQIFFNDVAQIISLNETTRQFALHGPHTRHLIESLVGELPASAEMLTLQTTIAGVTVTLAQRRPLIGDHWIVIVPVAQAAEVWEALRVTGQTWNLKLAGSLLYNVLRIRAGRPGVGRELTPDYIPLEAGLWDEVNFHKGCYTGQEIIARMESRNRLAKTMVQFELSQITDSPAKLMIEGKEAGTLTSSVQSPLGECFGIGFVKIVYAEVGTTFQVQNSAAHARITQLAGVQPPLLTGEPS
jgi:tRNA-modifying protein YgfZ